MLSRQFGWGLGHGIWLRASVFVLLCVGIGLTADFETSSLKSRRTERVQRQVEDVRAVPDVRELLDFDPAGVPAVGDGLSGLRVSGAGASPGIAICAAGVSWELQHLDGGPHQVATLGSGSLVHFVWTGLDRLPGPADSVGRWTYYVGYNSSSGLTLGDCGTLTSCTSHNCYATESYGGFTGVAVGSDELARLTLGMRLEPGFPFRSTVLDQGLPGFGLFMDHDMPGSKDYEAIYPHIAIDHGGSAAKTPGDDVFHVVARSDYSPETGALFYWRRVGTDPAIWEGPVILDADDGISINHHVATNPVTGEVAVIYLRDQDNPIGLLDVVYVESADNGADWITNGTPIFPAPVAPSVNGGRQYVTAYNDPFGPQSWLECTGEYDLDGRLHVVWVEQAVANVGGDCRIRHWDDIAQTPSSLAQAVNFANTGGDGARDLWLAYPQIGIGDGSTLCTDGPANPGSGGATSNRNYLYATYQQYGGTTPEEGADVSASSGVQNLEICLAVSNDHGLTWSPPLNLTNTQTPGCDGTPGNECASEAYPSIALVVNDTIHISYILDEDAGDVVWGQGSWTFNPVMYYRIPGGTDVQPVCPALSPVIAASLSNGRPECEYNAPPGGSVSETLTIQNLGNAALTGSIGSVGEAGWLQFAGGTYTVNAGGPDDTRTVTMDASALTEGLYRETISITHNDTTQATPIDIPVDFFVFTEFACPEYATLNTGWVWLEIGNTGRMANHGRTEGESPGPFETPGGLFRFSTDSSWSLNDASLLIAMPLSPDTLVWRNIYGAGNGLPGFRALSSLVIDTFEYGTATGMATAWSRMTTMDSTIGIDVSYQFPQHPDSAEFVLVAYRVYNQTTSPILDLAVGAAADFDVVPGADIRSVQRDVQNSGHLQEQWNMVYQQGRDTVGHTTVSDTTASRYKAGMTAIQTGASPRAWIAPNDPWLYNSPGGGFTDGYLYREMNRSGFVLLPPNDPNPGEDLHAVMVFEQNVDLEPGAIKHFALGLISSNQGNDDPTDLIASTKKAWKYAFGWVEVPHEIHIDSAGAHSVRYYARGTHEDGVGSPCSGCVIDKISGSPNLTIVPGPDPCFGEIWFTDWPHDACGYKAEFRVRDLCGTYEDIVVVSVPPLGDCICPYQGDLNGDGFIDATDLILMIDVVFFGGIDIRDPGCLVTRSDFNNDCFADAVDISNVIDHMFFGGYPPTDPCMSGSACRCQ